ncbi:putative ribonuclease H-like domain-containing protein [Tanacetum coccineum]
MLSNSPLSSSTQSTDDKDVDEVPDKGYVDKEGYDNNTNRDSTASLSVSTTGPSINTASENINTASPTLNDSSMQPLENTGIFDDAYNDREVGVEADLNNLETTMNVSAIPTTRIHKDHLIDQIIGDINSATQTRRMTKIFEEHAMIEEIRLLFAYASFMGLIVYQMDVKGTFLYGNIEEEVYVCQPPGFEDPHFPDKVYKVEKALYGLHQALRAWFETLSTYLLENGYRRGTIDKTLFIKKAEVISYDAQEILDEFYGGVHFLIRITASTPIEANKALIEDEEAKDVDVHLYGSMIGLFMYLIASRPDIMFAIYAYARFQVAPKISHLHAVKRIFRYLKGQPKLGLWYPRDSPFDLESFSDSDYAGASLDRKSTIGGCQFLGKRLISWQCKKQTIVANSTTEVEYVAAANCCGQTQKPRKAKRITEISQSSGPIHLVADETVYKEWEDRMERAATTASSLEAEQDSGNINRTQSMATLNESLP